MNFMKYQRSEWEFQKVRIKKIVGHCNAALPEQYVNTLLTMLEERNPHKAESAEKSDNKLSPKLLDELRAKIISARCGSNGAYIAALRIVEQLQAGV